MIHLSSSTRYKLILFLLNPLISFFVIFPDFLMLKRKSDILLVSMIMGVFSMLIYPYGDMYRHALDYYSYDNLSVSVFFNDFLTTKIDSVFYILGFIFNSIGFSFELFRFSILVFSYSSVLFVIKRILNGRNIPFYFGLFVFFSVPFFLLSLGLRNAFANSIFFLGVFYLYCLNRKILSLLLFGVAGLTHASLFFIFPLIIVTYFFRISRVKLILIVLFLLVFNEYILSYILMQYSGNTMLEYKLNTYLNMADLEAYLSTYSFFMRILYFISFAASFLMIPFVLLKRTPTLFYNFLFAFSILLLILLISGNILIYNRYAALYILLFTMYMSLNYDMAIKSKKLLLSILFVLISVFCINLRAYTALFNYHYKLLYEPFPMLLMTNYPLNWMNENITIDGTLRK